MLKVKLKESALVYVNRTDVLSKAIHIYNIYILDFSTSFYVNVNVNVNSTEPHGFGKVWKWLRAPLQQ